MMNALMDWILATPLSFLITSYRWSWPIAETLHFTGLVVFVGTVAVFDLRLLGFAKGITPLTLHRFVRIGVLGFLMLFITGIAFISGAPDQYFFNNAFYVKVTALAALGLNVAVFYVRYFRRVVSMGANDIAPLGARVVAGISLTLLVVIMCAGRLLTFFRPIGFY